MKQVLLYNRFSWTIQKICVLIHVLYMYYHTMIDDDIDREAELQEEQIVS